MDFKQELKKYQNIVEEELNKYRRDKNCPEKTLNESMEYSLIAGGKKLRPILILSTYQIFKDNIEYCMPYAVAIEMIHNFSLIHDDLPAIDNDDFRHGKLTNHKKFNESTAILAGDGLMNYAYMVISEDLKNTTDPQELKLKLKVFNEFTIAVDRMIVGEYVDTEFEGKPISSDYLEYMHKNKTGALIRLCVRIGAILGEATDEQLEELTSYAEKIGLAFQIKDDILSEEGDELVTGKPVGNDREKNKCTYVTKFGLQKSKDILEKIISEAVAITEKHGKKGEFLKQLAIYIKDRNK